MFGPNIKADSRGIYYHHREGMFHEILQSLENIFINKFGLQDYNFIFLTGNGTTANETVISSFCYAFNFLFTDAEFGRRLYNMSLLYNKSIVKKEIEAYPLYETSISRLNLRGIREITFLDMVSAFPYYLPPRGTAIWTTVSSKQIGASPVLGIVGVHKDLDLGEWFESRFDSCLNLIGHFEFRRKCETHTTPAIPLFYDLLTTLINFDRKALVIKINSRRKKVLHKIGIDNVIGCGPVITFTPDGIPEQIAVKFNLYRSKVGYQIFLWSGTDDEYELFYRALERV